MYRRISAFIVLIICLISFSHNANAQDTIKKPADTLDVYFKQLSSTNDTLAQKAYATIADGDPLSVRRKIREYALTFAELREEVLPMFPVSRLSAQLDLFDYCRKNNIVYKPSASLKMRLDSLKNLNGSKLYKCENRLIETLTLEDITGVEYWGSIGSEEATYSIGRILDKFYSNHFSEITSNEKQLRLFLKKSYLYEKFGIIGVCNKYLWKFAFCKPEVMDTLRAMKTRETDKQILTEIGLLLHPPFYYSECNGVVTKMYSDSMNVPDTISKIHRLSLSKQGKAYSELTYNDYFIHWVEMGNMDAREKDKMISRLEKYSKDNDIEEFDAKSAKSFASWLAHYDEPISKQYAAANTVDSADVREDVLNLVTLIGHYTDLPALIGQYKLGKTEGNWFIEEHIKDDLGIPVNIADTASLDTLMARYKRLSEIELYKSYLYDFGYQDLKDDSVNYAQLYDMLEFDIADGFVGGGGGRRHFVAFTAIRFLELHLATKLGFSWRLEYYRQGFTGTEYERACAWMKYLRDHNLVKIPKHSVPSFSN